MDKLMNCAKKFERLLYTEYYIKAGKSNKMIDFMIDFKKEDFFHLAGLHKLKDIDVLVSAGLNKGKIFDKIISGEITYKKYFL